MQVTEEQVLIRRRPMIFQRTTRAAGHQSCHKEGAIVAQKMIMTVGLTTELGKEAELSRWYREVHIPERRGAICKDLPGLLSTRT